MPKGPGPDDILKGVYCEACRTIINISIKELYNSKKEHKVFDVLSNICDIYTITEQENLLNHP